MKRNLFSFLTLLLLLLTVSLKSNADNWVVNKGTITIYVGEERTLYHSIPYEYYVQANNWFIRQRTGASWSDGQGDYSTKIVSKTSSSCTIKGLSSNESSYNDGTGYSCELHCKGTKSSGEYYEVYWTIVVKSYGYLKVEASPAGGTVNAGTTVTLTAKSNGSTVSGCDIYYTLDGTTPTENSTKYTSSGVTINNTCQLSAKAFKYGYENWNYNDCYWYFTIQQPVTSLTLNSHLLTLKPSDTYQLRATIKPSNANDKSVTWSSLDTNIADVSSNGLVTAKKLGVTKVICKSNDNSSIQDTCIVLCSNLSYGLFTAPTEEGAELTYYVDRYTGNCMVWNGNNNTAIDKGYTGKITIPNEIFGLKVTQIGNNAFRDCTGITEVVVPSNVTKIGRFAFLGCTSLATITGMDNVESIGISAFSSSLSSSQGIPWYNSLPDGLVYIGKALYSYKGTIPDNTEISIKEGTLSICSSAFSGSGLVSASIPKTVKELGGNPFRSCNELKRIIVASGNTVYDSRNSCNAIIETATNKLVAGCTGTIIPSTVRIISSSAFNGSVPEELVIPNSVDSIANNAVSGKALKSLIIGSGLRKIHSSFRSTSITSISVASSNPYFDSRNNCNAIIEKSTNTLVVGCPTTIIPSTVKSIGGWAFYVNTDGFNYGRITIPESVETIGQCAFQSCNIGAVVIGSNVSVIEKNAFYACGSLVAIYALSRNPSDIDEEAFAYQPNSNKIYNSTTLIVPIGTIANYRSATGWNKFSKIIEGDVNTMVEGMTITNEPLVYRVTSTENKTCELYGTTGTVTGNLSIPSQVNGYTVTNIAYGALRNQEITSLNLPATVDCIWRNPVYGCNNLTSVTVDAGNLGVGISLDVSFHQLTGIGLQNRKGTSQIVDFAHRINSPFLNDFLFLAGRA